MNVPEFRSSFTFNILSFLLNNINNIPLRVAHEPPCITMLPDLGQYSSVG